MMLSNALETRVLGAAIDRIPQTNIVVLGDIILDRFIYGSVRRVSPEAPVPVVLKNDEAIMLGGAANVAMNLLALGASVSLIGLAGLDRDADTLKRLCGQHDRLKHHVVGDRSRRTTVKTRIVAQAQQVMRLDEETIQAISPEIADQLFLMTEKALEDAQAVVLSDYAKGVLGRDLCHRVVEAAHERGCVVLVDPKNADLSHYGKADLFSPNLREIEAVARVSPETDEAAVEVGLSLLAEYDIPALLITRGAAGMTLVEADGSSRHFRAEARSVFDVSGAGDTVIATIAAGAAAGLPLDAACALGNSAAGLAVAKAGTSTVQPDELRQALNLDAPHRPLLADTARAVIDGARDAGRKIGFTNGCFDLLHKGHLHSLETAKAACDVLVVGVNSDASVKRLKGPDRPIQDEATRARVLACLAFTDIVVIFDEDTPEDLISALQPDILFKGADYEGREVVGRAMVEARGGKVVLIPLIDGVSTTQTVNRMKAVEAAAMGSS